MAMHLEVSGACVMGSRMPGGGGGVYALTVCVCMCAVQAVLARHRLGMLLLQGKVGPQGFLVSHGGYLKSNESMEGTRQFIPPCTARQGRLHIATPRQWCAWRAGHAAPCCGPHRSAGALVATGGCATQALGLPTLLLAKMRACLPSTWIAGLTIATRTAPASCSPSTPRPPAPATATCPSSSSPHLPLRPSACCGSACTPGASGAGHATPTALVPPAGCAAPGCMMRTSGHSLLSPAPAPPLRTHGFLSLRPAACCRRG